MTGRRKIKRDERSDRRIKVRFEEAPCCGETSGKIDLSLPAIVVFSLVLLVMGAAADRLLPSIAPGPPGVHASTEDLPLGTTSPGPSVNQEPPGANSPGPQTSHGQGPGGAGSLSGPSGALPQETGSQGTPVPPPPPDPALFHKEAVRETIHKSFPLTPEDIRLLKRTLYETQQAVHGSPPVGRAVSLQVSLDPGASFPVVHLVPGIASTVTVVDATGAPWPIEDVIVGNSKSFPVRRMSTSNGVVIEPKNNVGWTSLSLVLKGRGTPAVLKLVDSDHLSDTRVTARIEGRGPNAIAPLFREPKPVVSARILAFLDGIPPPQAQELHVVGTKDMEAWRFGSRLFVRTHMDVLAPSWIETVEGPNGMKLYVFSPVSVITAAGENGEMVTVELREGGNDGQQG